MAKSEWGTKHTCQSCGAKYYDLRRTPITCPKCGAEFDPDALLRSRRGRSQLTRPEPEAKKKPAAAAKPAKPAKPADDEDVETGDDDVSDNEDLGDIDDSEEDDDVIEDASELGEDDDVMSDVVIGEDDKEER